MKKLKHPSRKGHRAKGTVNRPFKMPDFGGVLKRRYPKGILPKGLFPKGLPPDRNAMSHDEHYTSIVGPYCWTLPGTGVSSSAKRDTEGEPMMLGLFDEQMRELSYPGYARIVRPNRRRAAITFPIYTGSPRTFAELYMGEVRGWESGEKERVVWLARIEPLPLTLLAGSTLTVKVWPWPKRGIE